MKLTPTHIQSARRHLRAADPVMKAIIDAVGPYTLQFDRDRFGLLVRSIISQQLANAGIRQRAGVYCMVQSSNRSGQ
jgi:DNA-3-methyladenine glycosylase II